MWSLSQNQKRKKEKKGEDEKIQTKKARQWQVKMLKIAKNQKGSSIQATK